MLTVWWCCYCGHSPHPQNQLHLSLSLSTGGEDGMKATRDTELIPVQSLNLLLKSIGATLTDVQDVVFKYAHMPSHTGHL